MYIDLTKRLERIARRIGKAHDDDLLDYTERFDKALAALKKRRFETASKELDRIPVLGLLTEQRRLFDEYKKGYTELRARCEALEEEIQEKTAYYESLQKIDVTSLDELTSLKEKIAAYNESVGTFLETSFKEAPLTDVLEGYAYGTASDVIADQVTYSPNSNVHIVIADRIVGSYIFFGGATDTFGRGTDLRTDDDTLAPLEVRAQPLRQFGQRAGHFSFASSSNTRSVRSSFFFAYMIGANWIPAGVM